MDMTMMMMMMKVIINSVASEDNFIRENIFVYICFLLFICGITMDWTCG